MRILLVEDHQDSANMLALVLRGNGHDVLAVGTAGEALQACVEAAFDLLISDIGLPDLNGWELLARLRAHCAVPAIALTAFSSHEDRERSRAAGFDPPAQAGGLQDVDGCRGEVRRARRVTPARHAVPLADAVASSDAQIIFGLADCQAGSPGILGGRSTTEMSR